MSAPEEYFYGMRKVGPKQRMSALVELAARYGIDVDVLAASLETATAEKLEIPATILAANRAAEMCGAAAAETQPLPDSNEILPQTMVDALSSRGAFEPSALPRGVYFTSRAFGASDPVACAVVGWIDDRHLLVYHLQLPIESRRKGLSTRFMRLVANRVGPDVDIVVGPVTTAEGDAAFAKMPSRKFGPLFREFMQS